MSQNNALIAPVVHVWAKEPARGAMLEDVSIRQLGDRHFIVGRLAGRGDESDSDNRIGLVFWFAVDEVIMLTEYTSIAAARDAYKAHQARKMPEENSQSTPQRRGWFS